jgi:hypothetical protein
LCGTARPVMRGTSSEANGTIIQLFNEIATAIGFLHGFGRCMDGFSRG